MSVINKEKLLEELRKNEYDCRDCYTKETCTECLEAVISVQEELQPIRSNCICTYCSDENCTISNTNINSCCFFKGRKVIFDEYN